MKILFTVGSCLEINNSANFCHIAYIRGAVEAGHDVDVISMSSKGCLTDDTIALPEVSNMYVYDAPAINESSSSVRKLSKLLSPEIKAKLKNIFYHSDSIYGKTAETWISRASAFKSDVRYDAVISLATPYSGHLLASILIGNKNVITDRWIQIWEDPWSADLYVAKGNDDIRREEARLLSLADEIFYVSPLTLKYQKELFPESSDKMKWHPLPYYYRNSDVSTNDSSDKVFGYFGDYYSFSRDIKPLYGAASMNGTKLKIIGNTDLKLENTETVTVKPRIGLGELKTEEDKTDVLVFLSNLKGGQIPGKLYQYSATEKPILFILDGTDEEKHILRQTFEKYGRYVFCDNTEGSISEAMKMIKSGVFEGICNECVDEFSPLNTINGILGAI